MIELIVFAFAVAALVTTAYGLAIGCAVWLVFGQWVLDTGRVLAQWYLTRIRRP